ncbi:MBL fold metallo-hydrolase [Microbacterium sp. SD291]|uniref:MBL fold metallo-hydrolase n=1 Tax=Microbacterium sp. SD291 TaxID=2782007 RepID=UPI001A9730F2|nr:MBL fold metallo-hydrolase [Microbacterium sp. SD291]MBO0980480.1 MBL fold metallo-hydrolase [Microbacterium sp. SD291]
MTPQLLRIGDDIVAIHAIVTDEGVTLIDAGLSGDLGALRTALAGAGRSFADIRGVVLTHGDADHIGIAERLRADHGVPVHILAEDVELATGAAPARSVKADAWRLGPALRFLWVGLRRGGLRTRHPRSVRTIADGDVLDLPGRPEIIAIPGHTRGSAAIRVPAVGALFLGDAITTRHVLTGEAGARLAPFSDDPQMTRRSLEHLRALPESRIFPGHGPEFAGTAADLLNALDSRA